MGKIFKAVGMGVVLLIGLYLVLLISPLGDDAPYLLTEEQRTICAMAAASADRDRNMPDYCSDSR
jgi:hypothetical protein